MTDITDGVGNSGGRLVSPTLFRSLLHSFSPVIVDKASGTSHILFQNDIIHRITVRQLYSPLFQCTAFTLGIEY